VAVINKRVYSEKKEITMEDNDNKALAEDFEKKASDAFDSMMDLFNRLTKESLSLVGNQASTDSDKIVGSMAILFSGILQECLIEIGIADGDFDLNERLFVEKIGNRYPISLLSAFVDSDGKAELTWDGFFAMSPHERANFLDQVKKTGTPLALQLYSFFASVDLTVSDEHPYLSELKGYLVDFINAYLSIDLERTELENTRAVDVLKDNILNPLEEAYDEAGIEAHRIDGKA